MCSVFFVSKGNLFDVYFTLCWFVVYSTRGFVLSHALFYFVLVFFRPFNIVITSLGEEKANLSAFRTFVRFALVWFCLFHLPLRVWDGLRLVIVAPLGLFSYLFYHRQWLHYDDEVFLIRAIRFYKSNAVS